jgi:hypothetical protein
VGGGKNFDAYIHSSALLYGSARENFKIIANQFSDMCKRKMKLSL